MDGERLLPLSRCPSAKTLPSAAPPFFADRFLKIAKDSARTPKPAKALQG
jgi:hypothetical protein